MARKITTVTVGDMTITIGQLMAEERKHGKRVERALEKGKPAPKLAGIWVSARFQFDTANQAAVEEERQRQTRRRLAPRGDKRGCVRVGQGLSRFKRKPSEDNTSTPAN